MARPPVSLWDAPGQGPAPGHRTGPWGPRQARRPLVQGQHTGLPGVPERGRRGLGTGACQRGGMRLGAHPGRSQVLAASWCWDPNRCPLLGLLTELLAGALPSHGAAPGEPLQGLPPGAWGAARSPRPPCRDQLSTPSRGLFLGWFTCCPGRVNVTERPACSGPTQAGTGGLPLGPRQGSLRVSLGLLPAAPWPSWAAAAGSEATLLPCALLLT